ncbi:MAG: CoA transferase [Deltaproteobacteria bacterium]|nr:CoA transferase [Deltaproteobacteria bacterium]
MSETGVLDGVRVVEVGCGLSAPVVGMLLAEQGADVVRVTDPGRPPVDPVLDAMMARGKTDVALPLADAQGRAVLDRLVAAADVVVDDLGAGGLGALGIDAGAVRRDRNPGLVACSIPAFPASDPRAGTCGHEAAVGAAGTLYERPLGAPRCYDFPVASSMAGLFAANGVVAALLARLKSGAGQDVEVTRFHAALFAQILSILMKTGVPRGFLPLKMIGTPFMRSWLCRDGRYIYLHITLPAHAARILEVLESAGHADGVARLRRILSAETMRDPSQVKSIAEAKRIREAYERIFLARTADDWERVLGAELCCIKVRTADEWVRDSIAAGMSDACALDDPVFGELLGPGPGVTSPERSQAIRPRVVGPGTLDAVLARWGERPVAAAPADASSSPAARPPHGPPLAGVRVIDLSRIIAGPCSARVLAELGADVISVQNPTGLDWALSFHLMFNAGKRTVTLDFTGDEGKKRLWALLDEFEPDVLVQNYRNMDVARAVGVDPEPVRARFPGIVYTHMNAYGDRGDWKERPGFEQVVQAVSGIQMTYGTDGKPKLLPTAIIDIGCGLTGAFATVLGLYHKARTGEGITVSTHLTWASVLFQVHRVAAAQRDACVERAKAAGVDPGWAPGREVVAGVFPGKGGYACVAGPRCEVEAWARRLGARDASADPLAAVAERLRRKPVAAWGEGLPPGGAIDVVPVQRIRGVVEQIRAFDPSPRPVVHRRPYPGCASEGTFVRGPIRLSRNPVVEVGPPPVRGGSTRDVMATVGETLPEGAGVIPYPKNKPFLIWLVSFIRWGYFAWRSGNV